jgi:hypothetical protein
MQQQELMVELHPRECTCRGAMWMMPRGTPAHCASGAGTPVKGTIVISLEQWRSLGKPRTIETHEVAVQRAMRQASVRAS